MWKPRRLGRPSVREHKEAINNSHKVISSMIADPVKRAEYDRLFVKDLGPRRAAPKPSGKKLESAVNDEIYDVAKQLRHCELWRNNRGVAHYGNQRVRYGVGPNGAADWIGYRRVTITQEMVGSYIAQFVAIEAKAPDGQSRDNQQAFLDRVSTDGGCAGVAKSGEDAKRILE